MSSGGQILGGLVGAVVGFFSGGPTGALYGAQIGMLAGGYLDPPKGPKSEGPRLSDLTVQTSTYGAVIPRVYGIVAVNGNIMWLENNQLKETVVVTSSGGGGKGGGGKSSSTTKTHVYSATFAVGLCKGPIAGIRRIWVGPDLFYDAMSADVNTLAASNAAAQGFAIYLGTDTQNPDARMQATLGAGNTPAWRGLAYIVFYDLDLTKYANSLVGTQVRVEVLQYGVDYAWTATSHAMPASRTWSACAWNGSLFCAIAPGASSVAVSSDGYDWSESSLPATETWQDVATNGNLFVLCGSSNKIYISKNGITWSELPLPASGYSTQVKWGGGKFLVARDSLPWVYSSDGLSWTAIEAPGESLGFGPGGYAKSLAWNGSVWLCVMHFGSNNFLTSPTGMPGTWTSRLVPTGTNWNAIAVKGTRFCVVSSDGYGSYVSDDGISWTHSSSPSAITINSIAANDEVFLCAGTSNFFISEDGITWESNPLPYTGTLWNGAVWNGAVFALLRNAGTMATIYRQQTSSIDTSTGAIVSEECLQSGILDAGDIDITDLDDSVRGYRVGTIGSIRSAIEPLQGAWPFDVVPHGYKIKFSPRGSASVATIPEYDLNARAAGESPGVRITTSREMDSQLPRRVTVNYLDFEREYDAGAQYAERINTDAINARVLDLPVVLTTGEAAGKAEVLLYLYWLERHDVSFVLPPTYNHLEPGDVVTLETPEGYILVRLSGCNYTSDGRVECKAKYADAAIYTSTAVGEAPAVTGPTTIPRLGPAIYTLMDIPLVSSAQASPSFLVAMTGALPEWDGGYLMRSTDDGNTWAMAETVLTPGATMGIAADSIGSVEPRLFDEKSILTVDMLQGELVSVTDLALFAGANYFAYGADRRWEIIAVKTCTLVSGNRYTLQSMLRGRFGTEWAMDQHAAGDWLVLLDATSLSVVASSTSVINLLQQYRGITAGRDISTDASAWFAYGGVNLRPLAPVHFSGTVDPLTRDWRMSWVRRTRTGGEWRDYYDAPVGESSESYAVDLYTDGSYYTIKRTITSTSPECLYTADQQISDDGALSTTIYCRIYQVSPDVGRGYGLSCSATAVAADGYSATITIPAASVSSSLTAFPMFIDLSQMSAEWWSAVWYADGRDIRAIDATDTEIPTDLVQIDRSARTGALFVKTDLSSAVPTTLTLRAGRPTDGAVDPMDIIGRNAVWTNYHRVLMFGTDHANRAGSDFPTTNAQNFSLAVSSTSPNTGSHQGVAFDGTHYYVSDTNGIKKYDSAWSVVLSNTDPVGDVGLGTNHVGDIEVVDGILYAPVENYVSISSYSRQRIARFSALTLEYLGSVSISAQGHEASSIAYCDKDGLLYVSSYADGSRLWKYDPITLAYVGTLTLSTSIAMVKGITWWQGAFWINSGSTKSTTRVEYNGTVRNVVWSTAVADNDYEGIGHNDAGLLVLIDSIASSHNGVVKVLTPIAVAPLPGTEMATGDQFEYATGLSRYTTWTMGAHVALSSKSTTIAIMSYTVNGSSSNADRVTLAYGLSADRFGLWNDVDNWLYDTASPSVGAVYRLNASHNGTSGRKIYRNGTLTNSAGSSTARPSASANVLAVGIESWTKGEDYIGKIGFCYLAPTQFSDAYIAAESSNLLSPGSFYTVTG